MTGTILLIEDDARIAEIAIAYLERAGFRVEHVSSGRDAIARVSTDPPSLAVLDLMLPDLSGEAVCREMKEIADIPVVILTAKASEEERLAGLPLEQMTISSSRSAPANLWRGFRQY